MYFGTEFALLSSLNVLQIHNFMFFFFKYPAALGLCMQKKMFVVLPCLHSPGLDFRDFHLYFIILAGPVLRKRFNEHFAAISV